LALPFGDECQYHDFAACLRAHADKDNPDAFCAELMHRTEDHCAGKSTGSTCKHQERTGLRTKLGMFTVGGDDSEGRVTSVFATFNTIDRDGDVVLPEAIPSKRVIMSAAHDWGLKGWIGEGKIAPVGNEALFEGRFYLETGDGRDAYEKVKAAGDLVEWSWGFQVLEGEWGKQEERDAFFIKKADVFEVSPVLAGAGVNTRTLMLKSAACPRCAAPSSSQRELSPGRKRWAELGWDLRFPQIQGAARATS
jgi:hypothetical protein